jgi:hypothetical protein
MQISPVNDRGPALFLLDGSIGMDKARRGLTRIELAEASRLASAVRNRPISYMDQFLPFHRWVPTPEPMVARVAPNAWWLCRQGPKRAAARLGASACCCG